MAEREQMKTDEINKLRDLCRLLRESKATAVASEEGQRTKTQMAINVVVAVVIDMDQETYDTYHSAVHARAKSAGESFVTNILNEVGDLGERLISSHEAAQAVMEAVAGNEVP